MNGTDDGVVGKRISCMLAHHQLKMNAINKVRDELLYERITPEKAMFKLDMIAQGVI